MSIIDFSAQFGGRNAASAVLPHFKLLKSASKGLRLDGFPFETLAFILRVNGEINNYGSSGAGNLEIGTNGDFVSIDIGVTHHDRDQVRNDITSAISSSVGLIQTASDTCNWDVNFQSLMLCLDALNRRYQCALGEMQEAEQRCQD